MFAFSKIFLFFFNPGVWLFLLLTGGTALLWTRWRRAGRLLLTATLLLVTVPTILPVGHFMTATLEDRFPVVSGISGQVDGIVVLGGTISQLVTRYRGQPSLSDGAERLTEFIVLAKQFPSARLVFSSGSGSLTHQEVKEADTARLFFQQMGLDPARVIFEAESRNTYENAVYSHRLAKPREGERWILVTSAMHMPRAVGVFRKAGWNPIAFPVDFHTYGTAQAGLGADMLSGLSSFATGLREWAALVAYRLLGRTDVIFPSPHS